MNKPGRKSAAELAVVPLPPQPQVPAPAGNRTSPPAHLSAEAADWWKLVVADFDLEPHHLRLLQSAAEAWDRMQQAREALAAHGALTFTDEKGTIRAHPCVAMERDARIGFARLVRELDLDGGPAAESRRPPSLGSNRRS